MDVKIKQANDMLKELEENKIDNHIKELKELVPLFYSLAISSIGVNIITSKLKNSNLI